jgi:dTDP-4-dehydrorhamnose reductase
LLSKTIEFFPKKVLIYFSSISVHTTNTPYTRHKIIVEEIIKKKSKNYFIFRISQVVGFGGNQNNFFNFMKNKIQHMEEIEVFNTIKSLVDIDDLYSIVTNIITKNEPNQVLDFAGIEFLPVLEIVQHMCVRMKNFPKLCLSKHIDSFTLNSPIINQTIDYLEIDKNNYSIKLIEKYC